MVRGADQVGAGDRLEMELGVYCGRIARYQDHCHEMHDIMINNNAVFLGYILADYDRLA